MCGIRLQHRSKLVDIYSGDNTLWRKQKEQAEVASFRINPPISHESLKDSVLTGSLWSN